MEKPKSLSPDVVELFAPLLDAEYKAFYFYRNVSNYCKNVGFFKAAEYFAAESADELVHAQKLQDFLVDWNITPELPSIDEPEEVVGLMEAIQMAYDLEYDLYEGYEAASSKVFKIGDICVFDLFQYFRGVQNKSVAEYSDMINMLEGVDGSKFELLMLEKKLF